MVRSIPAALAILAVLAAPAPVRGQAPAAPLRLQVMAAESSFAASFARRDTAAFAALLAPDAVFFGRSAMRGKAAVLEGWGPLLRDSVPPFSWAPETVEVAESGQLAFSSGPVYSPEGKRVGTFNSVWRREPDGRWLVLFDKGCP